MGMWQNLVAGYEANADMLHSEFYYPYTIHKSVIGNEKALIISLDENANLISIEVKGEIGRIALLVTEESAVRTSSPIPHCLFDKYKYFVGKESVQEQLFKQIEEFAKYSKNANVAIVLKYCRAGTLKDDVINAKVKGKIDDSLVLFCVNRNGVAENQLWRMPDIYHDWVSYQEFKLTSVVLVLDALTGRKMPGSKLQGRKVSGNAKLITSNDGNNYTYRGMLSDSRQVVEIGRESLEKAHQFLFYLLHSRGIRCDTQVLVTWTIDAADDLPQPPVTSDEFEFEDEDVVGDEQIELAAKTGIDFAQAIRESLTRGRLNNAFVKHPKTAVLMLDAATDGRMAVVFYRELASEEYLERIAAWHESAAWRLIYSITKQGEDGKSQTKYNAYVGAPTVDRIIQVVFGRQKSASDDGYKKMKRQVRELIVRAIFDGQPLPKSFIERALTRLSRPLSFIDSKDKYGKQNFMDELAVFCSMLKQNYLINRKEKIEMQLDVSCSDRNYLFGRLLGAADKLEEYALSKGGKDRMVTAAIRYMQLFAQRPFTTWGTIHNQLQPYIQKVKGSIAFCEIEAIKNAFSKVEDFQDDAPLTALYLLGYYQERNRIAELARAYSEKKENDNQTSNEQE